MKRALQIVGDDSRLWVRCGEALVGLRRREEALTAWARAAELAPDEATRRTIEVGIERLEKTGD